MSTNLSSQIESFGKDLKIFRSGNETLSIDYIYLTSRLIIELYKVKNFPISKEILDDISLIAYKKGDYELLLDSSLLSYQSLEWKEEDLKRLRFNQHFSIEKLFDKYISPCSTDKMSSIEDKGAKLVTITMTSCKRLDLFKKTVYSFLNCCQDLYLINEWIVVDDNSSNEDRTVMKTIFPFIKFIFKTTEEKGHAKSMNILRECVKTPYVFHMEDDWIFYRKEKYLDKCIEVLQENINHGQCLINREYGERSQCFDIYSTESKTTEMQKIRYYTHYFLKDKELSEFNEKNKTKNCVYWPHYSLRPGMMKTSVWRDVGPYNENSNHFEMEYGYRYISKGYETCFLDNMYSWHTGRCTFERFDETKENAYSLNDEKQFGEKAKIEEITEDKSVLTLTRDEEYLEVETEGIKEYNKKYKMETCVVNMKKRPDRMKQFIIHNHDKAHSLQYSFFEAIDGELVKPTPKILKLFETGDYGYRTGIIGCALSHIVKLKYLIESKNLDCLLILEDDIELCDNFLEKLVVAMKRLPPEWDILFLGHFLYPQYRSEKDRSNDLPIVEKWTKNECIQKSMGGTIGYIINKEGAGKLLNHIKEKGVYNAIDWVIFKTASEDKEKNTGKECNIYYSYPHLVYSECVTNEIKPDSDIQYNFNQLCKSPEERYKYELEFYLKTLNENGINFYDRTREVERSSIKDWDFGINHNTNSKLLLSSCLPNRDVILKNICFIMECDINYVKQKIECLPVHFYTILNSIVIIPITKVNKDIIENVNLDNSYLFSSGETFSKK